MQESPYADKPTDPELVRLHNRMRAKLIGFLPPMSQVLQSYPESDKSLPARYARATAYYRVQNIDKAVTENDALPQERPHDPPFHLSTGQILPEQGTPPQPVLEPEGAG